MGFLPACRDGFMPSLADSTSTYGSWRSGDSTRSRSTGHVQKHRAITAFPYRFLSMFDPVAGRRIRTYRCGVVLWVAGGLHPGVESQSPCSGAPTAPSTRRWPVARLMPSRCVTCWWHTDPTVGRWCSLSTPRRGRVAMPKRAPNAGSTIRHRPIRRANRSWPAGRISGSHSWIGPTIHGPRPST